MTDRDRILAALPEPDGRFPEPAVFGIGKDALLYPEGPDAEHDLWALFAERAAALGVRFGWPESVPGQGWFVEPGISLPFDVQPESDVWQAAVGVSRAVAAVAETGSVMVAGGVRLASLAPPIHVVVVPEEAWVLRLEDAVRRLHGQNAVLITGPSRTADIEGVMVHGAHGPRELWVVRESDGQAYGG